MAETEWFYRLLGLDFGPVSDHALKELIDSGTLHSTDEVRSASGAWRRLCDIPRWSQLTGKPAAPVAESGPEDLSGMWYFRVDDRVQGPVTLDVLKLLSVSGQISPSDRVREGKSGAWFRAATLPGLFADLNRSRSVAGQAAMLKKEQAPQAVELQSQLVPDVVATRPGPSPQESQPAATTGPIIRVAPPPRDLATPPRSSPNLQVPSPTPRPQYTPPRPQSSVPRFTPTPTRSSIDWSGMFAGGGDLLKKGLAGVAVVAVLGSLWFGKGMIGASTEPKSEEFWELSMVWNRVVEMQEVAGAAEQWTDLQSEVLPQLDSLQSKVAPLAAGQGEEAVLAQHILEMVDTADGPTKSEGLLRRIVASGGKPTANDMQKAVEVMSEAASLLHGA